MYTHSNLFVGILLACSPVYALSQSIQSSIFWELTDTLPYSLYSFSLNETKVELSPRIASDNTHLHIFSSFPSKCTLQILSLGDEVLEIKELWVRPGNQTFPLSLYEIPPGWYWVSLTQLKGEEKETLFIPLLIER